MKILVTGSGGREHALAWKLAQSARVTQVSVAPGNPGTGALAKCSNVEIAVEDIAALLAFAQQKQIDLTVVGPEVPLALGMVDVFQRAGQKIFGPTQAAAQLEYSKAFSKQMMRDCGVPTADFAVFEDYQSAIKFAHSLPFASAAAPAPGCVVKADGLAAGKGVFVCDDLGQADEALTRIMVENEFGESGARVVIEERLSGREVSALAFVDGRSVVMMPPARDHKRVGEGDTGPNTGGMGAFAPAPDVSPELMHEIKRKVIQPIVDGMAARGMPYMGVLYAGLMLSSPSPANSDSRGRVPMADAIGGVGVSTLEFNCRFGDPETQVLLPLLQSDLAEVLLACVNGALDPLDVKWHDGACATVVLASAGYPGAYAKGLPISGLDALPDDVLAFHAGTSNKAGQVVTSGGRVLSVSAVGSDLDAALARAYVGASHIHFDGVHYRKDIGRNQNSHG